MKKFLVILLVLALAGLANGFWIDDYESYTPGDPVAGSNGWLAGGIGGGDWLRTGAITQQSGVGGSVCVGSESWRGNHKDVSESTGTFTINALFNIELEDRAGMMLGQEPYGTGAIVNDGLMLDYNGGWYLFRMIGGVDTQYGNTLAIVDKGWYEVELSTNLDDDSAYASWRDVDDATGLPISDWTQFATVPAGSAGNAPILWYGVGTTFGALVDGFAEPPPPFTMEIVEVTDAATPPRLHNL